MRKTRTLAAALAIAGIAAFAGPAQATTTGDQIVSGVTASTLALGISTPAVTLLNFAPGSTASGSGALLVTSTNPWTLKVADGTGNAGHLAAAALGCTGSEASTSNAVGVTSTGLLGGTASSGLKTISGVAQTVATGAFSDTVTNAYSLLIGSSESMLTGCAYTTTATYTVQ